MELISSDFERIVNGSVRKELRVHKNKIADLENRAKEIIHQLDSFSFEEFRIKLYDIYAIQVTDVYVLFKYFFSKIWEVYCSKLMS